MIVKYQKEPSVDNTHWGEERAQGHLLQAGPIEIADKCLLQFPLSHGLHTFKFIILDAERKLLVKSLNTQHRQWKIKPSCVDFAGTRIDFLNKSFTGDIQAKQPLLVDTDF